MESCVFCLSDEIIPFEAEGKAYSQCHSCGGIFLNRTFLPSAEAERKRYEQHHNNPQDAGFTSYLESFIDPVLDAVSAELGGVRSGSIHTIFDYGSGPEPVLVSILSGRGFDVRGWDPFFAPEVRVFEGGADLVVCHEVAEHFFKPRIDFSLMAACIKPGGCLAVGTMTLPDRHTESATGQSVQDFFASWWYRQDSTHVSFYTPAALRIVGEAAGLEWIGAVGKNAWIFRRPGR